MLENPRIIDIINGLEYNELSRLKKDITSGSINLKKLIDKRIKDMEKEHEALCSVCFSPITPFSTDNYTILFGPKGFTKKATFCAMDCLEYFIKNLKELKKDEKKINE